MIISELPDRKIKQIHIKNFQNHKNTVIDLENGLNLIVGSSDSGKTAIARAIHYVINDAYSGNHFVCYGEKFFDVKIEFADGAIIRRIKGKDINRIEYKYPNDVDFTIRSAFGEKYPDDVVAFLANPPHVEELGYLSYSDQSNKNFLLDLSPSQFLKAISSIIGVNDLEKASSDLSSKSLEYSKLIKTTENEISEIDNKIETNFVNLDEDKEDLDLAKKLINEINNIDKDLLSLENLRDKYLSLVSSGNSANNDLLKAQKIIDILENDLDNINSLSKKLTNYENLYSDFLNTESEIFDLNKLIDFFNAILDGEYKLLIDEISGIENNLKSLELLESDYQVNCIKNDSLLNDLNNANKLYDDLTNEYEDLKKEIKEKKIYCLSCNKIGGETL